MASQGKTKICCLKMEETVAMKSDMYA